MSVWQRIKNFFKGEKPFAGIREREEKSLKRGAGNVKGKRKDIGHAVGMGLLIFVLLVMLSETTLAIVNLFFWKGQNVGSFVIPIAVMPTIAIVITVAIVWINNENNKMAVRFITAFEKVSRGEYGYRLEVPAKGRFKELFENFNKMSTELASVQTLKDGFVHDFSHEFKTPIASINGFANLLLEGGLSEEEQRQYLGIIARESERLSALAENTLMINRLENQQFVGEAETYRLDTQLKDCIILLERQWTEKGIDIFSEPEPAEYRGNAQLMQQVWLNIINNAVKFTPRGGKIGVKLVREGGGLKVSISDTGIGMSEEVAAHVFDKYYQGDSSRSTAGNGLGLSIARHIVTLAGGDISVRSRPGEGSTFTVTLPA